MLKEKLIGNINLTKHHSFEVKNDDYVSEQLEVIMFGTDILQVYVALHKSVLLNNSSLNKHQQGGINFFSGGEFTKLAFQSL